VVEPIDPSEGGHFQILHVAPWTLAVDQLGFVETVNRLNEGVIRVPDAAGRWFDACFAGCIGRVARQLCAKRSPCAQGIERGGGRVVI